MISTEKPGTPEELVHFGIKGMKWGVRKAPTSSPELKSQARKAFGAKTEPLMEVRIRQMLDMAPLTMSDYRKMSTSPTSLPAGKSVYRMTETPKDVSLPGYTFVSTNKRDATIYRGLLPAQRQFDPIRSSDYKQHYEVSLKTKKTLRGPSEKERVDILAGLMSDKTAIRGKMSLREYYKKTRVISRKEAKNSTDLELALKVHRRVHQVVWQRNNAISQAYVGAVTKRGYDILSDDNDSGTVSRNPMIILNPQKSTSLNRATKLSNDDILKAQIDLNFPVSNLKRRPR